MQINAKPTNATRRRLLPVCESCPNHDCVATIDASAMMATVVVATAQHEAARDRSGQSACEQVHFTSSHPRPPAVYSTTGWQRSWTL